MKHLRKHSLLKTTVLAGLAVALGTVSASALAQVETTQQEVETAPADRIVVTGSRLRRDEFSSISPLQVIDADQARLVGLVDAGAIIADAPTVSGAQLDGSVQAGSPTAAVEGVPATGLGGNAVALRGLGAERTLLLVNGRRLAPSGVRGAPVAPDLNLIPGSLIDRVEILTDGASSIYGADAVAGVANVILRSDVDGLEFTTFATMPEREGGEILQFGMIGGASNDRGNFTVALEYFNRTAVIVGDRPNFNDCRRDIRLGTDGVTYSACADSRPANSAFVGGAGGFVFYTPGTPADPAAPGWANGRPANWTRNADLLTAGTNFRTTDLYTLQDSEREANLLEELERVNIFATGYQDINIFSRDTFYFEASYASRNSTGRFPREQVFPTVPAFIPMEDANGNIMVDPVTLAPLMFANPQNPFGENALPVVTLADFPQRRSAEVSNMRFVFGLEGDLALGGLQSNNWVYDAYVSYDRSFGSAWQNIIIDPHLREAMNTLRFDNSGNLICGTTQPQPSFGFPNNPPCVPINFFSPTLFTASGGDGTFATQAEADYLFGRSITTTTLEQAMASFTATGDVFEMPAGTVGVVLGAEFRELRISSLTDIVRSQGLASSEVPDLEGDTIGRTSLWEMFVETELPLFDFFDLNLSGRYTSEENFGSEFTYSVKGDLRPTDWLRIRSTYGTTFRAPNLREQFLAGQAGTIAGTADPCRVPTPANVGGVYDPTQDTRSAELRANCVAAGVDPTALGLLATTGIPTTTGGNPDAEAETSDSFTLGAVFTPQFSDRFDLNLSVTYFDIEINNTLRESNPATILAQCYGGAPNLGDPACDRITRAQGNPATAVITNVDASFINIGRLTSRGLDYNARFSMPVGLYGYDLDFTASATVTQLLEQEEQVDAAAAAQDFAGTISSPEWRGNFTATLGTPNWMVLWRARYIGEGQQLNTPAPSAPTVANACGIIGVPAGVLCSPVDFTDSYWQHDLSISFERDNWSLAAGVINVFDETPPLITQGSGPARMNIVVQSGHDLIGRRAFVNLSRRF